MPLPAALPAFLLSFLLGALPAAALQTDPERSPVPARQPRLPTVSELSFQIPLFHPEVIDPVNVARLQVSLESVLHATLDDTIRGTKLHIKAVFLAGVLLFDRTVAKVGHELGHMAVYSRAGYSDFRLAVGAQDPEPLTARELFINSLTPFRRVSVGIPDDDTLDARQRFSGTAFDEFNAATFAAGLNQEQIHLNHYRDRVLRHQFGFFDTVPYTIESLSTLLYSGAENADLEGYRSHLDAAGFTTSIPRMKAISMVRLLSGSAVSAASGFYRAMTEEAYDGFAPRVIARLEGWTVLWPEFESFLSRRGPTVRASLPLRAGGFLIVPGLEQSIADGGSATEAGVEASRRLAPWLDARASLFAASDRGYWAEAGVAVKPSATASVSLAYHVADRYTFHREMYGETLDLIHRAERGLMLGMSLVFRF
jgi:hypothetical protein